MNISTLPNRYKNLYISTNDLNNDFENNFENDSSIVNNINNYQKFETQYFFVYKDPITGKRCSSPIQEPEKTKPINVCAPIGNLRNEKLYLIQTKDKTYKIRSPNSNTAVNKLKLNSKDVIRASIICEGA